MRFLNRLWAWFLALFESDGRPPPRRPRETDGLYPPASPSSAAARPAAEPFAPELNLETDEPPRYARSQSLLTFQERKLYLALLRAAGNDYQLMAKVRLADFIYLANLPKDNKHHRNQILCKHVDFLLCQPGTLAPLLAIELDDSSHQHPDNAARDEFKNELFAAVGLPLWRIDLQPSYSTHYLRRELDNRLMPNS